MTSFQSAQVRHAMALLQSLLNEPRAVDSTWNCPVIMFVRRYLVKSDPSTDVSCGELLNFFNELSRAGELPPMRRTLFLRRLPEVMESVYQTRKSHNIVREGCRVRGFRGVDIREISWPPPSTKQEPPSGPMLMTIAPKDGPRI